MSIQRPSRLLAVLLVLVGFAGVLIERVETGTVSGALPAQGAFWRILTGDGDVKQVAPPSEGIVIAPGDSFQLEGVYSSASRLESLTLRVQNTGRQSGYVRVNFREQGTGRYRLLVVPGEPVLGTLSYVAEGRPPEVLAQEQRPGMLADPGAPFDLALRIDGPRFVVEIDGKELLRASDDRIPTGNALVWADSVRLLRADVSGSKLTADATPLAFSQGDDLRAFLGRPDSLPVRLLPTVLWALAVLLAAAGYLRNLCLGAPPVRLLWRATFAELAPAGAVLALRPWAAVPFEPLLLVLAGSIGLLFALYVLRAHVRAIVPSRTRGGVRILIVVAVLGGLAAWVHARARFDALRPIVAQAERALSKVPSGPFTHRAPLRLGPSNALTVPGPYGSLDLDAEVTLAPDSLLELRLHSQSGLPNGIALFLSTDARWSSGFVLESKGSFKPLGGDFGVLEAERAYELSLRVVGDEYEAGLDGRPVSSAQMRAFPSGSVVALAARGKARLAGLGIRPIVPEPPVRDATDEARAAGSVPWMLLGLLALAAAVLLIIPFPRALEAAAWMLVPIAIGVHGWAEPYGRLLLVPYLVTLLAFLGFALPWTLLHSHRSGPLRTAAFLLVVALLGVIALNKGASPPGLSNRQTGVVWNEFDLPRITSGLSHLQHPYIRRFNSYIINHRFRSRTFSTDPGPGVVRVVSMGTSSTWGHGIAESTGLDYPTVLEGLLSERLPGQRIEVINGAVRGSSVARLLRVFRESLLSFQPDIVTLSVYFNDSVYLTQVDEDAYLTHISRPDYEHTVFERVRDMLQVKRGRRVLNFIMASMDEKHGDSIGSWRQVVTDPGVTSPPERFEAGIRAFAELGREHGFRLVLIKEPIRGNVQRIWRDEFRAVMDRLGEEYGLPVVDPAEALEAAGGRKLFMDDIHPLPAGHRIVAEVLAPVIERLIRERSADR